MMKLQVIHFYLKLLNSLPRKSAIILFLLFPSRDFFSDKNLSISASKWAKQRKWMLCLAEATSSIGNFFQIPFWWPAPRLSNILLKFEPPLPKEGELTSSNLAIMVRKKYFFKKGRGWTKEGDCLEKVGTLHFYIKFS